MVVPEHGAVKERPREGARARPHSLPQRLERLVRHPVAAVGSAVAAADHQEDRRGGLAVRVLVGSVPLLASRLRASAAAPPAAPIAAWTDERAVRRTRHIRARPHGRLAEGELVPARSPSSIRCTAGSLSAVYSPFFRPQALDLVVARVRLQAHSERFLAME